MRLLHCLAALSLVASAASSQVPDGWYVYGTFQSSQKGETGIFMNHPRNPGKPIAITGLNADLKWVPNSPVNQGASCLVYRPSDGALIVGERAPNGHSVDLHIITLNGNAVAKDVLYSMGTSATNGEIAQAALLPDGKILVGVSSINSGPMKDEILGIVDPVSGNVTAIPSKPRNPFLDYMNAVAASEDGKTAYYGTWVRQDIGEVFSVPLPKGGTPTLIAKVPGGISNLSSDGKGNLWVATIAKNPTQTGPATNLYKVHIASGKVTPIPNKNGRINAISYERTTGNLAVLTAMDSLYTFPPCSVFWMTPEGKDTLLSTPDKAVPSGISYNPNPEVFGTGTNLGNTYTWQMAPNPGGLPTLGNSKFGLVLDSSPGQPQLALALLGQGRLSSPVPVLGFNLLLAPAQLLVITTLPGAKSMSFPLPIPKDSNLSGARIYFQAILMEGLKLASSRGVEFTIL